MYTLNILYTGKPIFADVTMQYTVSLCWFSNLIDLVDIGLIKMKIKLYHFSRDLKLETSLSPAN